MCAPARLLIWRARSASSCKAVSTNLLADVCLNPARIYFHPCLHTGMGEQFDRVDVPAEFGLASAIPIFCGLATLRTLNAPDGAALPPRSRIEGCVAAWLRRLLDSLRSIRRSCRRPGRVRASIPLLSRSCQPTHDGSLSRACATRGLSSRGRAPVAQRFDPFALHRRVICRLSSAQARGEGVSPISPAKRIDPNLNDLVRSRVRRCRSASCRVKLAQPTIAIALE